MIDGKLYRYHEPGSGQYHGLCGRLYIERPTYREVGVRNGRCVVPLELDAGLLAGATPALAYKLCEGYAQGSSHTQHKALLSSHRVPPSRSTMERISKELGSEIKSQLATLEPVVRAQEQLPQGAHSLALGLDRTSVPMEEPAPGGVAGSPKNKRTTPYVRMAPAPVEVNYRMAYVGTVSMLNQDGRALITWRYGASDDEGSDAIVARMMNDVKHARSHVPALPIVLVQDGAPELWNTMSTALDVTLGTDEPGWCAAIDRHHLLERFADALGQCTLQPPESASTLHAWNERLDHDDEAIDTIEAQLIAMRDGLRGEARDKLDKHLTYIDNNKHRMRYAVLRQLGLPVGSGPTEGACKSLVMIRAKGCGQRWHYDGLDAVLTLRALDMSERLAPVFNLFADQKRATIRLAA
jgi:hypothetical protein